MRGANGQLFPGECAVSSDAARERSLIGVSFATHAGWREWVVSKKHREQEVAVMARVESTSRGFERERDRRHDKSPDPKKDRGHDDGEGEGEGRDS